jgi:hypothetical protein
MRVSARDRPGPGVRPEVHRRVSRRSPGAGTPWWRRSPAREARRSRTIAAACASTTPTTRSTTPRARSRVAVIARDVTEPRGRGGAGAAKAVERRRIHRDHRHGWRIST